MDKLTKVSKIILSLTIISFIIWLGSYITRQLYVFQFFEPENLDLQTKINSASLPDIMFLMLPMLLTNLIAYSSFLVLFFLFILISRINLKNEGWLFIITMLLIITAPFEIYLLTIDFEIIVNILNSELDAFYIIDLLRDRMTILSSFAIIEVFSCFGIVFLAVFKPLKKY